MSMCWNENPEDRPNFQNLKDILYKILDCKEISQVCNVSVKTSHI
jgi:hypothetical protein